MMPSPEEQKAHMLKLANQKMFFGKHKGQYLIDLPEPYLIWLGKQDLKDPKFRDLVTEVCSLKENGLEGLIRKLRS
ncbi:DUF3820 family protein [bacterium]|nr:DUF3820 family protein [bacterium]